MAQTAGDRNRPQKHVQRARIGLLSGDRLAVLAVARQTAVSRPAVWRWQQSFAEQGVDALLRDKRRKLRQGYRRPNRGGARPEHGTAPEATNAQVADKLRQAGDILAMQGAAPFRVAAYRRAVDSILALTRDLGIIVARGGRKALEAIPGVGVSIAGAWHLSSPFSRSTP
jgi:Helix-hairpin-helix domain